MAKINTLGILVIAQCITLQSRPLIYSLDTSILTLAWLTTAAVQYICRFGICIDRRNMAERKESMKFVFFLMLMTCKYIYIYYIRM